MIIFGLDSKQQATPAGTFHCPVCQAQQPYARLERTQRFTLFFVPVLKVASRNLHRVVCTSCGSEFAESQVP